MEVQRSAAVRYHKDLPARTSLLQAVLDPVGVGAAVVAVPYTLQDCILVHNMGNEGEPGGLYHSGTMS